MKFKFYQPGSASEKGKPEPVADLHLEANGCDGVDLIATVENGDEWCLLTLNSNGTFSRHGSVGSESGFKVNKIGYLKEQK